MAGAPASMALQTFKAEFFKALAHPVRIRILEVLRGSERSVQELQAALELDQSTVSQQLAILRAKQVVTARKEGTTVRYTVRDAAGRRRCSTWRAHLQPPAHRARQTMLRELRQRGAPARAALTRDPSAPAALRAAASSPSPARPTPSSSASGRGSAGEIHRLFGRSLHIRQVDAGSCNGCELEIAGLTGPHYDLERFGLHFVASPRHADCLLVTGPVTRNMAEALRRTWEATPGSQDRHRRRRLRARRRHLRAAPTRSWAASAASCPSTPSSRAARPRRRPSSPACSTRSAAQRPLMSVLALRPRRRGRRGRRRRRPGRHARRHVDRAGRVARAARRPRAAHGSPRRIVPGPRRRATAVPASIYAIGHAGQGERRCRRLPRLRRARMGVVPLAANAHDVPRSPGS